MPQTTAAPLPRSPAPAGAPRRHHTLLPAIVLAAGMGAFACGGGAGSSAAAEPQRIDNPELGITVEIPADSRATVAESEGAEIRLELPADEATGPGTVTYAAGPRLDYGPNLVEAVKDRQSELEAKPDGQFFGQLELGTPYGPAYSTRGRFSDESGQEVEETKIFTVHPSGDRILGVTYHYVPVPGDTKARLDRAMTALGWFEPLATPDEGVSTELPAELHPVDPTAPPVEEQ